MVGLLGICGSLCVNTPNNSILSLMQRFFFYCLVQFSHCKFGNKKSSFLFDIWCARCYCTVWLLQPAECKLSMRDKQMPVGCSAPQGQRGGTLRHRRHRRHWDFFWLKFWLTGSQQHMPEEQKGTVKKKRSEKSSKCSFNLGLEVSRSVGPRKTRFQSSQHLN